MNKILAGRSVGRLLIVILVFSVAILVFSVARTAAAASPSCADAASPKCYFHFVPSGTKGRLHYQASLAPAGAPSGSRAGS